MKATSFSSSSSVREGKGRGERREGPRMRRLLLLGGRFISSSSSSSLRARGWKLRELSQMAEAVSPEDRDGPPRMPPFEYVPPAYDGPPAEAILKKRTEFLSPSLFHFYKKPVKLPDPRSYMEHRRFELSERR